MATGVEWVVNPDDGSQGFALNPVYGCQETAPECDNCYARSLAAMYARRFKNSRYAQVITDGRWNGNVNFYPEVLDQPRRRKKRTTYFVGDMADIALPGKVQDEWLELMWNTFVDCPQHIFLVLSKHPSRILRVLKQLPQQPTNNVWIGTTIGHPNSTYKLRPLRELAQQGYSTFIGAGPLLGRIDYQLETGTAHWLILEGESKPEPKAPVRPCYLEDMEYAIRQCRQHNVAVFVKQLGLYPLTNRTYAGRTTSLSAEEYEMLKERVPEAHWFTPQTQRYVHPHKKGGGESTDGFPRWAQIRELPYLN